MKPIRESGLPGIGAIHWGTHICYLYENQQEILETTFHYVSVGLEGNERCICLYPDTLSVEFIRRDFNHHQLDMQTYVEKGQLVIKPVMEVLDKPLEELRQYWLDQIKLAEQAGFEGIRVVHEPLSGFGYDSAKTFAYEELLNHFASNASAIFLCLYDLPHCDLQNIINMVCTHEYVVNMKNDQLNVTTNSVNKEIHEAVQQARDFYLTLLEEFPAYMWRAGLDAKCNYFNKTWLTFTGRTLEQELGDGWAEGVHPDDLARCFETYMTNFKAKKAFEMEYRLKRYDGVYRWILDIGRPFYYLDGSFAGYIGSCFDITETKELNQNLETAMEEARRANDSKSVFLSHVGHEVRTPINAILGIVDLMLMTNLTEEQAQYIELARENAEHLTRLVHDLLDLAQIEAGMFQLENADFELHQTVQSVIESLQIIANKKKLPLELIYSQDIPGKLVGDEGRLRQILVNLVNNAIKFTEQGKVQFSIEVTEDSADAVGLLFSVEDTGVGIKDEDLNKLFKRFSQLNTDALGSSSGTGLGLAISAQLIRQMGSVICVESELGKGSTFWFKLRLPKAAGAMRG